jgi:hypothetical protein
LALKSAEQAIFFDAFFILLVGLYGISTTQSNLSAITSLPAPNIAQFPGLKNCQTTDLSCNAANLNTATAYIAIALFNLLGLLGYIIIELILFLNIVLSTAFSPALTNNGIPIAGTFFVMVQFIVLWEVFRNVRGAPSGF